MTRQTAQDRIFAEHLSSVLRHFLIGMLFLKCIAPEREYTKDIVITMPQCGRSLEVRLLVGQRPL